MTSSPRSSCWSITINNPSPADLQPNLPPGWKLQGQIEKGKEGTEHYQAMLVTPQVRFSAVKRHLPRAHIEPARSRDALQAYVNKADTRVATVPPTAGMTAFQLTDLIVDMWDDDMYKEYVQLRFEDPYLAYADTLVKRLIAGGTQGGIEYVAINPMWRSAWKRFGHAIIMRNKIQYNSITNAPSSCPPEESTQGAQGQADECPTQSVQYDESDC